jgi:hypothetical protein
MENQTNIVQFVLLGCLAMFSLIVVIILFFVIHLRKMAIKEVQLKNFYNEKQLTFSLR